MIYQTSQLLRADPANALDLIVRRLTLLSFRIESQSATSLTMTNSSFSSRPKNPLRSISRLEVRIGGGNVSATARIDAHRPLFIGLFAMICVMSVGFCVLASYLPQPHHHAATHVLAFWPLLLPVAWVIVLPLMYWVHSAMARKWLNKLLREAAMNGASA
jgi:hypothetical protein